MLIKILEDMYGYVYLAAWVAVRYFRTPVHIPVTLGYFLTAFLFPFTKPAYLTMLYDIQFLLDDNKEKEFFVRVADNGDIPLDATSLVSVTFSSLSDLPSFSSEQISVFVDESEEIGAEVTRVCIRTMAV